MNAMQFSIDLDWEFDDEHSAKFTVKGKRTATIPAKKTGRPDIWTPGEGGELEDLEICDEDGENFSLETKTLLLSDPDFIEQIHEELDRYPDFCEVNS